MAEAPPRIHLARHGQTEWSRTGRHTGREDPPLTAHGEEEARRLGDRLRKISVATVLSSPLQRARKTCELAGFGDAPQIMADLMEWDYGKYEGLTTAEIRARRPGWTLFRDGCPGGERLTDVIARADRLVAMLKSARGDVLVFSHGHFLRVLTTRWAGFPAELGGRFLLASGALSVLGTDAASGDPVLDRWNDVCHLEA